MIGSPGKKMTPCWENIPVLFFPVTPSSQSWTLEGLFELTQRPSRAFNLAWCIVSGTAVKEGHHQVFHLPKSQDTAKNNWHKLDCLFSKKTLFWSWSLSVKSQQNRIVSDQTYWCSEGAEWHLVAHCQRGLCMPQETCPQVSYLFYFYFLFTPDSTLIRIYKIMN